MGEEHTIGRPEIGRPSMTVHQGQAADPPQQEKKPEDKPAEETPKSEPAAEPQQAETESDKPKETGGDAAS